MADDQIILPAPITTTDPARLVEIERLYHEAFEVYGARALWNMRHFEKPTPGLALAICGQLRVEGDMGARRLAERIERACRADQ